MGGVRPFRKMPPGLVAQTDPIDDEGQIGANGNGSVAGLRRVLLGY